MGGWRPLSSALRGWGGAKAGTVGPPARPIPFPPGWPERWSQAGRRAPLVRHRPGKPRLRHPETPAMGCAFMADTARLWGGQRLAQGHTEATRSSSLSTQVFLRPQGCQMSAPPGRGCSGFSAPGPLPLRQLITELASSAARGRLGDGVQSLVETGGRCLAWTTTPRKHRPLGLRCFHPRAALPLVLLKSPHSEEGGLAFSEAADLAARSPEAPVRFRPLLRIRSRFVSSRDEVRRGRKEAAAA